MEEKEREQGQEQEKSKMIDPWSRLLFGDRWFIEPQENVDAEVEQETPEDNKE